MNCGRYVSTLLLVTATVLMFVTALNLVLIGRSEGNGDVARRASEWQAATRGVTYPPPLGNNRAFKALRLHDRLPEINTVVFGSSTAMGITADVFPADMPAYNFSQSGNPLRSMLSEAEYLLAQGPASLRWFVIPVDWALGFPFEAGEPGSTDLAPAAQAAYAAATRPGIFVRLADALSLPRVKSLGTILWGIVRASSPLNAFGDMFLQDAGDDYRCPDGTPGKDFDTIFRGTCTGFRFDGSATFANLEPVSTRKAEALVASARVPSSKYASALIQSGGALYPGTFDRLARIARTLRARGGALILFLPPLLPGLERALAEAPQTRPSYARLQSSLDAWSRKAGLVIIDAGRAEIYGCAAPEFVDEHHALPACYRKMFQHFPLASLRAATPGVYRPR